MFGVTYKLQTDIIRVTLIEFDKRVVCRNEDVKRREFNVRNGPNLS